MSDTHKNRSEGRRVPTASQRVLLALITGYQRLVSPFLPPTCRFRPTCSDYAAESIRTHGIVRGCALAVRRVCRCHPLHAGGSDPVPAPPAPPRKSAPKSTFTMKEVQ